MTDLNFWFENYEKKLGDVKHMSENKHKKKPKKKK
jgi:hypothetical protein